MLPVAPTTLPSSVANELKRLSPNRVVIVGGTKSVSDKTQFDWSKAVAHFRLYVRQSWEIDNSVEPQLPRAE